MAKKPNAPAADVPAMDYAQHNATYGGFLTLVKAAQPGEYNIFLVSGVYDYARFNKAGFGSWINEANIPNLANVLPATLDAFKNETGGKLSFETLVSGTSQEAGVGRDGVNCTVCHQILPTGLGTAATFTGQFTTGDQRQVYGPHLGPDTNPMQVFVNYTPSYSDHVLKSSLCSTCHTVITPARDPSTGELLGPQFPEQTPYLEWLNSAFQDESTPPGKRAMTCIGCHVPPTDEDGKVIKTALAVSPQGLTPREPFGRHHFPGSSSGMLRLIAKGAQFVGTTVPVAELEDQAKRSEAHVSKAADLKIESAARAGVLMMGPLMLIFATIMLIILGPFAVNIASGHGI